MTDDRNTALNVIKLAGRIDSNNSAQIEQEIRTQLSAAGDPAGAVIDASDLEYISSAGLRVILRIRKTVPDLKIINVSPEVYEILDMTGFTEMMKVEKAYRVVSVEGCEVIGEGYNGKVYRIDKDNVVKTYKNANALAGIMHEREVARLALVLGVPTAISYDIVRVGDSYGSVFELLNATSFSKILAREPERYDFCVREYVNMLKKVHSIVVPEGKLPPIKEHELKSARRIREQLPEILADKLIKMIEEIPESDHMVHGDYHTKNIVVADGEVLLIDMDTLSVGHPIFEFVHMYNAYVGFSEYDPDIVLRFQGFSADIARRFWHDSLAAYLGTDDARAIRDVEDKVRVISYANLLDWSARHSDPADPATAPTQALWKRELIALLERLDTLVFSVDNADSAPAELTLPATVDNLPRVMDFIGDRIAAAGLSPKFKTQLELAAEEIFVNIANYAYKPYTGNATVRLELSGEAGNISSVELTFIDSGKPYDPLKKADPDVSLSAEEREIGGLGIFMAKAVTDEIRYKYADGQNVLTLIKQVH
ncbi:MAG: anti-sigma factor antagonist [Clostridia bacterium]|nr:anti-sigma factor antagonist [Clostridia bacterium]